MCCINPAAELPNTTGSASQRDFRIWPARFKCCFVQANENEPVRVCDFLSRQMAQAQQNPPNLNETGQGYFTVSRLPHQSVHVYAKTFLQYWCCESRGFWQRTLDYLISQGHIRYHFFRFCEEIVWDELGFGGECACGAVRGAEAAPPAQHSSSFTISKVSPQSSTDEVKAKANLPFEEVELRADKTSNPCVRRTIKRSPRELKCPAFRPHRSTNFVNTWQKMNLFLVVVPPPHSCVR